MKVMNLIPWKALIVFSFLLISCCTFGTEISRPVILVENKEKNEILEKIARYGEMKEAYTDLKTWADIKVADHKKNPSALLDQIPAFGGHRREHANALTVGVNCGIMYFLTGDEAYAQISADILNVYANGILQMDPDSIKIAESTFFMDARVAWKQIGLTYDFIAPFLKKPDTKVYNRGIKAFAAYHNEDTQTAIKRLARYGLKNWAADSNHPLLEGSGILYNIMAIDDPEERAALVDVFVKGNKRSYGGPDQFFANEKEAMEVVTSGAGNTMGNGLLWARDTMLKNGGHWPETPSYSGFFGRILGWMDLVDRVYPQYKLFENAKPIFTAINDRKMFNYPNDTHGVAFGDSRRGLVSSFHHGAYQELIKIARRVGYKEIENDLMQVCKADLEKYDGSVHAYVPKVETSPGTDYGPGAFFSYDRVDGVQGISQYFQTAEFKHAGVVIQKNVNVKDKKTYGLMCYAGGAHYVHSHLSGLDLELYGAGLIMGGVAADVAGPSGRASDINRNYYRIYAGHNTVIVNGESHGREKGSWKSDGMLYMDRTRTEAMEPEHMMPAISKEFTFSSQRLDDNVNNCVQQRIVSIVRTGEESGYYFDMFRSISMNGNKYSDYIYHNVGDKFTLSGSNGEPLVLYGQDQRYKSSVINGKNAWGIDYQLLFPGWHYFENVKVSSPMAGAVQGAFALEGKVKDRYMHIAMPGGVEREYASVEAPPILEAADGYDKKKARVLTIRQTGECWKRPFIVAYEPSTNEKPTIQSVENITDGDKVVGAKIVSKVGDVLVTDLIIAQDEGNSNYENSSARLKFKGRFAIIRTRESSSENELTLYIGNGQELSYQGHKLKATGNRGYLNVRMDHPLSAFTNK